MNSIRYKLIDVVKSFNIPLTLSPGFISKINRELWGYPKKHWIDAACVGVFVNKVILHPDMKILNIKCIGHGTRQKCQTDKFGFPKKIKKCPRVLYGFRTGDFVKCIVKKGKYPGINFGRITLHLDGRFEVNDGKKIVRAKYQNCKILQRADGYQYC